MQIKLTIQGSGDRAAINEALSDILDQFNALSDEEIKKGGDLENSIFTAQYDEN